MSGFGNLPRGLQRRAHAFAPDRHGHFIIFTCTGERIDFVNKKIRDLRAKLHCKKCNICYRNYIK
jgi:hypothetical protein